MVQTSIFDFLKNDYKITKPIRLIELFAGIGSQAKALKNIGANFEHYRVVEFDKYAIASYNAVHGTNFVTSDITQISAKDLEITDTDKYCYIMTYSFPCQDLSLAGKGAGMEKGSGTRSGLLWEVERILNECDELPQVLLMENVPQVHGKKNIDHFKKWISALEEMGYSNYWQDLNAKDFGIPQNRNRCFMISILGNYTYEFPKGFELKLRLKDMLEENVDEKYFLSDDHIQRITKWKSYQNPLDKVAGQESIMSTITTRVAESDGGGVSASAKFVCEQLKDDTNIREVTNLYENGIKQYNRRTGSVVDTDAISSTLLARKQGDNNLLLIKNATKQGYLEATDGDGCYITNIEKKRGTVQKEMIPTLKTSPDIGVVVKGDK